MKTFRCCLAAAILFAIGGAHAQLAAPAAMAFAKIPAPFERAYMSDEGEHPFTQLFDGYRTDPRLVAGINLNRHLALELGYAERQDRGFHALDPHSPFDTTGALGTKGFYSYAAAKASVPITDELSAYGKLGIAHSERRGADALGKSLNTDTGAYTGVGAHYRLNEKASVSVEGRKFGNTAKKWGSDSNGNRVDAKMKLGF